jgi:hypothetical protein
MVAGLQPASVVGDRVFPGPSGAGYRMMRLQRMVAAFACRIQDDAPSAHGGVLLEPWESIE